jgi:predicted amidohydrolase YtcJ
MVRAWGAKRANRGMPIRSWLEDGALVAGGSDAARPFDPMLSLWGMVTRGTRDAGVLGADRPSTATRPWTC